MDMNVVFQEFVTAALREALDVSADAFRELTIPSLDEGDEVHLRPDLVWRDGARHVFVGDAKYKNITPANMPPTQTFINCWRIPPPLDLPERPVDLREGRGRHCDLPGPELR